jgi:16S rRNA G966 N2-methylase RsmD
MFTNTIIMTQQTVKSDIEYIMEKLNKKHVFIDPPYGWLYGFPKKVTHEIYDEIVDLKEWCVKNGYPEKLVDSYGEYFFVKITVK